MIYRYKSYFSGTTQVTQREMRINEKAFTRNGHFQNKVHINNSVETAKYTSAIYVYVFIAQPDALGSSNYVLNVLFMRKARQSTAPIPVCTSDVWSKCWQEAIHSAILGSTLIFNFKKTVTSLRAYLLALICQLIHL